MSLELALLAAGAVASVADVIPLPPLPPPPPPSLSRPPSSAILLLGNATWRDVCRIAEDSLIGTVSSCLRATVTVTSTAIASLWTFITSALMVMSVLYLLEPTAPALSNISS